jgi:DNA-binding response OmpR family regulator
VTRVLVVEDQEQILQLIATVLRAGGFEVLLARSAPEAMQAVQGQAIDLLVTDVTLPGMDGCALAAQLRAERPGLRVLITSGEGTLPDRAAALGAGFLKKPFALPALLAAVRALL